MTRVVVSNTVVLYSIPIPIHWSRKRKTERNSNGWSTWAERGLIAAATGRINAPGYGCHCTGYTNKRYIRMYRLILADQRREPTERLIKTSGLWRNFITDPLVSSIQHASWSENTACYVDLYFILSRLFCVYIGRQTIIQF